MARFGDRLPIAAVQDLTTVVSELVNNAVEHGPRGKIDVRITLEDDRLVRGMVEDRGDGEVAIRALTAPPGQDGFGLRIVDAISRRWGVYPGSSTVWFEIAAD